MRKLSLILASLAVLVALPVQNAAASQSAPAPGGSGKARGTPIAAITIDVYSDFQCPACKALHEQTLKPLIADYVDKGRVYLRQHEFPLPMHQYAREAAGYACAAAKMGKYEQVADALFATQETWSKNGDLDSTLRSTLGPADADKCRKLAKTPAILSEIEADLKLGREASVNQTPTMILTHKGQRYPITGVVNYNILRRFLDSLGTR